MLTPDAINDFKDFIENIIAYAKVTVNGNANKMIIQRKERLSDGRGAVYFNITPQLGTTATIQRVQLYNKNNKLWADKTENIVLSNVQEGALYRFVFKFEEQEV
jgi:hypothetical protein